MTTTGSLERVTMRLQRADELLLRLGSKRSDFLSAPGRELLGHFEPESQQFVIAVSGPAPPADWGIVVSEFLHHLRTALDNLLVTLVFHRGGAVNRRTHFVICRTEKEWRKTTSGKSDALDGLAAADRELIAALQPGDRAGEGRNWLEVFSDMCSADRHSFAPPAFALAAAGASGARPELVPANDTTGPAEDENLAARCDVRDRAEVYRARLVNPGPSPELRFREQPEIDVAFGLSGPDRTPVFYADLVNVRHQVQLIVRLFEPVFADRPR